MAGSVIVTVGEAHDRLLAPLTDAARALHVGDGLQESTDLGPVVSCAARDGSLSGSSGGSTRALASCSTDARRCPTTD